MSLAMPSMRMRCRFLTPTEEDKKPQPLIIWRNKRQKHHVRWWWVVKGGDPDDVFARKCFEQRRRLWSSVSRQLPGREGGGRSLLIHPHLSGDEVVGTVAVGGGLWQGTGRDAIPYHPSQDCLISWKN